jgi:hypothetical protein
MAGSPRFKVFDSDGEYVACCKYLMHAAVLVSVMPGGTVRDGHSKKLTLWTEGAEEVPAGESYDIATEIMEGRIEQVRVRVLDTRQNMEGTDD